jgi:transcriptional regulator GlxA family with amidase domain
MFAMADRFARARKGAEATVLRVTHWRAYLPGSEIACVYDTLPGSPPNPQFIVIPLTLVDRPPAAVIARIAAWLSDRHARGAALGSVCSGAFLLAETGLLRGRVASTHWSCAEELKRRFPDVRVDTAIRISDYGDVVTVGGFMAWVDLGLRLIARYLGPTVAEETARFLLVRPGAALAPYFQGFAPQLLHGDEAILRAQQLIHAHDGRDVSLASLAEQARLERRTLLRRFTKATGMSPIEYCRNVRIARARELLEYSNKTLKEMAWEVGYDDTRAFARAFYRLVGLSPADYRRRYGQGGSSQAAA